MTAKFPGFDLSLINFKTVRAFHSGKNFSSKMNFTTCCVGICREQLIE